MDLGFKITSYNLVKKNDKDPGFREREFNRILSCALEHQRPRAGEHYLPPIRQVKPSRKLWNPDGTLGKRGAHAPLIIYMGYKNTSSRSQEALRTRAQKAAERHARRGAVASSYNGWTNDQANHAAVWAQSHAAHWWDNWGSSRDWRYSAHW